MRAAVDATNVYGQRSWTAFHKTPSAATTAGVWFDLSLSPGNPAPIYYAGAPLTALPLAHSTDGGIFYGKSTSTQSRFLTKTVISANAATALPLTMRFVDLLLAYPFVDEGTSDVQPMTNSLALTRSTNGYGVQVMAVSVAPAGGTGGARFQFQYTNSDGVSGRVSPPMTLNTAIANGQIISAVTTPTAAASVPFCSLQAGDAGVRSIQSVTMVSGSDVGLFTLVLCKPIAETILLEAASPSEDIKYVYKSELMSVEHDACLSMICCPNGSLAATRIVGSLETVWA